MYYVMSDIHGCYDQMVEALKHWDKEKEHLVIMGDLIDRGPESLKVVRHLMDLKANNIDNVTILMGNHEEMFFTWVVDTPKELLAVYYNKVHRKTILSFFNDKEKYKKATKKERALHILYNYKYELNWMMGLPHTLEVDNIIFVHAGINLEIDDWRNSVGDMLWIREDFIYSSKAAPKRVFFGHTPTRFLNSDGSNEIWISSRGDKVGIDGMIAAGGQLNALKVNENGEIAEKLKFT